MLMLGIVLGLGAAVCQSFSYLATRHFVQPRGGGSRMLLALSHVWMGVASAAVLPWVWPAGGVPWGAVWGPLFWVCLYYVLGQMALMVALRYEEPSRISPMLALKVVVLAGLTVALTKTALTGGQWVAVGLCAAGGVILNYAGGANHPKALAAVLAAVLVYSGSDWNIGRLVKSLGEMEMWRAFVWATLTCYVICGVLAAPLLPWLGSRKWKDWVDAAPFAGCWLAAMLLLFSCFGLVDVIYGNILQTTRGLISVVLGAVLARWGLVHLEQVKQRGVMLRRLAAAGLMTAAVVLWAVEKERMKDPGAKGQGDEVKRVADSRTGGNAKEARGG